MKVRAPIFSSNSAVIGAISFEWLARGKLIRINSWPFSVKSAWKEATAATGPETIQLVGELTAARDSSACETNKGSNSSSERCTLIMAPAGVFSISFPLKTAMVKASSREKTPDIQAATYSPKL